MTGQAEDPPTGECRSPSGRAASEDGLSGAARKGSRRISGAGLPLVDHHGGHCDWPGRRGGSGLRTLNRAMLYAEGVIGVFESEGVSGVDHADVDSLPGNG